MTFRSTIECICECMYANEIDVTETELRDYCDANSDESVAYTFDAAMTNLMDNGFIAYYADNNTFELWGA